jgi:hypothetical protein
LDINYLFYIKKLKSLFLKITLLYSYYKQSQKQGAHQALNTINNMSRPAEKLSCNDLARQRQLNLDAQKKVTRDAQIKAVSENQKSQGVRALITISQIPYLSIMHILSCLDNKSKIAYARVCKPLRASVMRNPAIIQKAVRGYHEECYQVFRGEKLIQHIRAHEENLERIQKRRSTEHVYISSDFAEIDSISRQLKKPIDRAEIDSIRRQLKKLIDRVEKKHGISYQRFKINEELRIISLSLANSSQ